MIDISQEQTGSHPAEGAACLPPKAVSCTFTGHRPSKLPWRDREEDPQCIELKRKIYDVCYVLYESGARRFICGMSNGSDFYFCEAVLALRSHYAGIVLEAAIPCPTQADKWSAAQRQRYHALLERCDYETMVSEKYSPGCMMRRNRYMVDHASLLIAAHDGLPGGTRNTIEYALKRGVNVVDIPI